MKYYKIYNATYELESTASEPPDAYAIRGKIVDDTPKGKKVGYVRMRDGSIIECYKKFNPLVIILPVASAGLITAGVFSYLLFMQPKDVTIGSTPIKQGIDNNVVSYNGFMAIENDSISVDFTNGDYPCTIEVIGEGITCEPITLEPGQYIESLPATFSTEKGLVQAKIKIVTDSSSTEEDIVVEIPDNNTPNSPASGLEEYWKGEYIYGTDISESE